MSQRELVADVEEDYSMSTATFGEWFTSLPGRQIYAHIPISFIQDDFNLYNCPVSDLYDECLSILLDDQAPDEDIYSDRDLIIQLIQLYEAIHQRYILTRSGLQTMWGKFEKGEFGKCPRVYCEGQSVLPLGASVEPQRSHLKLYCPKCKDVYQPPSRRMAHLDGFGFGPTFPHLLLLNYSGELALEYIDLSKSWKVYEKRIFGFKIHESSPLVAQMEWLRQDPPEQLR